MKKHLTVLTIVVILTFLLSATSFAWFAVVSSIDLDKVNGSIITNYFHCGEGSDNNPFVITRPVHLWNLTKLYQLLPDFDTSNYHFQIGYDLDGDGDLEVYEYTDGKATKNYSNILNMSQYTDFNPIGTVEFPFNGTFDGNNFTIANLLVKGKAESDVGVFGYVGADAHIKNCYFENLEIDISEITAANSNNNNGHTAHDTTTCYIGAIAGHCETFKAFNQIYLNNISITGSAGDSLQNNYGFFGYCADGANLSDLVKLAKGEDLGFGGSVDMESMYKRIEAVERQASTITIDENIVKEYYNGEFSHQSGTGARIEYFYDSKIGSFVWYPYSTTSFTADYNYLGGGINITDEYYNVTYTTETHYLIHSGTNYLSTNGTALTRGTNDNAITWKLSAAPQNNTNTTISTVVNGTTYYLSYSNIRGLSLSTSSYNWTYVASGSDFKLRNGTTYLRYNKGWTTGTSGNGSVFTFNGQEVQIPHKTLIDTDTYLSYDTNYVTYFPLIAGSDNKVADKNTGYIVSGSNYRSSTFPVKSGDIRVSEYATSDISNSYSTRNKKLTNVYTINKTGNRETVNPANCFRYSSAVTDFLSMISSGNIYGLHFMDGLIDKNNTVNLNYAMINGEEYNNYQMPADSIDFTLIEKGYITFFAGTYFSGNNSFFSLHKIERDENDNITDILEIDEIYGCSNYKREYIYKYTDGSYSDTLTADYSLLFKTSQIKQQASLVNNAVYYFEIPVNAGEYALGSVDGGTGAYLMYLDIGTNGGQVSVEDFGSIEYRTAPETIDSSILIISYEQSANQTLDISINYSNNTYTITASGTGIVTIYLLSNDYTVQYVDQTFNKIGEYQLEIK